MTLALPCTEGNVSVLHNNCEKQKYQMDQMYHDIHGSDMIIRGVMWVAYVWLRTCRILSVPLSAYFGALQNSPDSPLFLPFFPTFFLSCFKSHRKYSPSSKFTEIRPKARDNRIRCTNLTLMKVSSSTRCILQESIWPVQFVLYWLNLMDCKIYFTISNSQSNLRRYK